MNQNQNLQLELIPNKDKNGDTYYVAKLKGPFTIECKDGVVFLVFTSTPGAEVLQIAAPKEKNNNPS